MKTFSFSNTVKSGESLLEKLKTFGIASNALGIGMEATGHYWLSGYSYLHDKSHKIHVINPIQTNGWRKGIEIRKRKTDTIDSQLIADIIRYGDFIETQLSDEAYLTLKNLTSFQSYLIDSIGDLKRKVVCVLDQVFPEYQSAFSDIFGKTSREILLQFSNPADFESASVDTLAQLLAALSRKKIRR